MAVRSLTFRSEINAPAEVVFGWHERPGAFLRLNPPWSPVRVVSAEGGIRDGARVRLRVPVAGPFSLRWDLRHSDYIPGRQFRDSQEIGPFKSWRHTHRFLPAGPDSPDDPGRPDGEGLVPGARCVLEDRIEYEPPLSALTGPLFARLFEPEMKRLFAHRHRVTIEDIDSLARQGGARPMKIALTGSHGLVGSELAAWLATQGHEVTPLIRGRAADGDGRGDGQGDGHGNGHAGRGIRWSPEDGEIDAAALEGYDAVIHLAGESIAGGRWNEEKKRRIRESRVRGARLIAETIAKLASPPRVLICASAVGFYGSRGAETLTEESSAGDDFLACVCKDWEAATQPASDGGVRVVNLRFGVVLSARGGALAKMLFPFKMGVGGRIGSGEQYWSWIALEDVVGAIGHALTHDSLSGPVNVVAPQQVTNAEFTRELGRALHRPTVFPMPAAAARFALGEMADALLLASQRVEPRKLTESGYPFRAPDLETAFKHTFGK